MALLKITRLSDFEGPQSASPLQLSGLQRRKQEPGEGLRSHHTCGLTVVASLPTGMEVLYEQLQDDTRSFWQSPSAGVRRLEVMPSPGDFFRDYVATSTPLIISGGASACLKAERQCWEDLSALVRRSSGDLEVTVDFTPDGRGDCVVDVPTGTLRDRSPPSNGGGTHRSSSNGGSGREGAYEADDEVKERGSTSEMSAADGSVTETPGPATTAVFVKPEERRMKFENFVGMLSAAPVAAAGDGGSAPGVSSGCSSGGDGVPYLSHQNDSLRQEFPGLAADVEPSLALARETFGNEPDAVNLWIGDDRSVSAVHKDHYENMYCVLRGEKHFTLLPPSDVLFLYEQDFPQGRYRQTRDADDVPGEEGRGRRAGSRKGKFEVDMEDGTVPWIPVDPDFPDLEKYPLFRYASPVKCRVGPGDILYLPALWYHRVSQKGITVAVNYWHDMQFDHKYVNYRFLQSLAATAAKCASPQKDASLLWEAGGRASGEGVEAEATEDKKGIVASRVDNAVAEAGAGWSGERGGASR